jgi:glycosyltransferase involved in cell wall biosynthesis
VKAEKKSVIHVVTSLNFGGVERHLETIASELNHASMRHIFVAIGSGGVTYEKLRAMGVDVLCLGQKVRIPSMFALWALVALFRRESPTVVHTHGAEANFHGLLAAWITRVPVRIGEEIGIPGHSATAKRLFSLVYQTAHNVIGVSCLVVNWLIESGEVQASKAIHISNPVRLPSLKQREVRANSILRAVFVGRFESVKNPLGLLRGFSQFIAEHKAGELWFVGDGSQKAELIQKTNEMKLAHCVHFFGFQSNPENYIRQCHVYVQPSFSEGFGIGLIEAMACGVPVISARVGSAPEIVEHNKTGWLLSKVTPELIAASLAEAFRLGPRKLHDMGLCARASVEGRFDPIQYLTKIESLYKGLICEGRMRLDGD